MLKESTPNAKAVSKADKKQTVEYQSLELTQKSLAPEHTPDHSEQAIDIVDVKND